MISTRVPTTLAAALLALSACAPARAPAPAPAPAAEPLPPTAVLREPELLGEETTLIEREVIAVKRDILGSASYDLPVVANSWVEAELDFLVEQRREVIGRWLARGDYYQPFIERELRATGIPTDLFHLAMIESAFVPTARSSAGAVGFWQFMPATAKELGLRIDAQVDERMDPIRSTRAATRHLRYLHRSLGDWALAAAAYNAGSGRITRGLRSVGASDFWDLAQRGDLARETKQYVPRLFAVTVIGRDRERFGFKRAAASGFAFDSIQVEYAVPFDVLAKLGGVTVEQLTQLNPHLVQQTAPAGGYWVWVPAGTGTTLQRAWLASDFRRDQGYGTYSVRKGDTLGELAEATELRAARIRELNPRVDFDNLQIGEKLRLPYRTAQRLSAREESEVEAREEPARTAAAGTHTVESGETLSEIARDYDVSVEELRRANELSGSTIRVGQALRIPGAAKAEEPRAPSRSASHTVASGETLSEIARDYGVTVEDLRKANDLSGSTIRVGQALRVPAAAKGEAAREAREEKRAEHVVKSGDSLWTIARHYGSSVSAIQDANGLGDRPIRPGQKLTIPTAN